MSHTSSPSPNATPPVTASALPATEPAQPPTPEFIQLFTRYQRPVYLFLVAQLGRVADAEEVLQNTNVVLLTRWNQFQPGTNYFAWACQVARYEVLHFVQTAQRHQARFSAEFQDVVAQAAVDRSDVWDKRRQALEACLLKLRPQDRELIRACYLEPGEAAGKVVAERLGRPANSVYQSLSRIRRQLLECIRRSTNESVTT